MTLTGIQDEETPRHLRRMDAVYVATALDQLGQLDIGITAQREAQGWRESLTAHDAIRLTNTLIWRNRDIRCPEIARVAADIIAQAERTAGGPLPHRRRDP